MSDTPRLDALWLAWRTEPTHRQRDQLYEFAKQLELESRLSTVAKPGSAEELARFFGKARIGWLPDHSEVVNVTLSLGERDMVIDALRLSATATDEGDGPYWAFQYDDGSIWTDDMWSVKEGGERFAKGPDADLVEGAKLIQVYIVPVRSDSRQQ